MVRPLFACLVLMPLVALAPLACAPDADEEETAAAYEEEEVGSLEAEMWLDDFTLGSGVIEEGSIPFDLQTDEFAPGETIYLALEAADAPAGTTVRVEFVTDQGQVQARDEKRVSSEEVFNYMHFSSGDTSAWPPGPYRAEVWVGEEKVDEQEFQILRRVNVEEEEE